MAFRGKPTGPPPGYIPGIGRGAVGFTTRSDVGPAGAAVATTDGTQSRAAEVRATKKLQEEQTDTPQYDDEDQEADDIWNAIDEKMQSKRKRKAPTSTTSNPIHTQFRELKEQLAQVTEDQWAMIPDVGDMSLKYKQKRRQQDTLTGVSDSLLHHRQTLQKDPTASTPALAGTAVVPNISGLSAARETVLGINLDKHEASGFQTSVDATGYLTSLASGKTQTDIGDIDKARLLLKSVRDTNPKHGPGWIAAARVEEAAGKTLPARKIIQEACQACPLSEDVWLEAARLHPDAVAKSIIANAVRHIPTSVKLFLKAADLEGDNKSKKAVLRKALEANPTSVTLWKAAIDLEDISDARVLLSVAVEKIPHSVEMWLALARLETYANAQKVLNKARKALPADRSIWIAAAKLEESQNHIDIVPQVIARAVKSLAKHDAGIARNQWIADAERCEAAGAPVTCAAIVTSTIGEGVEQVDQLRTWSEDAKACASRNSVETARTILKHAIGVFPKKRKLWMQLVELERSHGTPESLDKVLETACGRLPQTQFFWLLRAKTRWMAGDVDAARKVLMEAFAVNPDAEEVWLAAAKLERENNEFERARILLQRARERAPSERVYMKSAQLEREQEKFDAALELIESGIQKYPTFAKFFMMGGQICSENFEKTKVYLDRARVFYQRGLEKCTQNTVLWILASRLEENSSTYDPSIPTGVGSTKARSLLELSRLKIPKNAELWLEAVRLERRSGNEKLAETLMAKALQECPKAGNLLAENIMTAPKVQQRSKSTDAIKRCPDDPRVIAAVASLFASERKIEKARKWFDRAVLLNQDLGDTWARYFEFELRNGTKQQQDAILARCVKAEPKHGELWTATLKKTENRNLSIAEGLRMTAEAVAVVAGRPL